jgi:hypothetical protein
LEASRLIRLADEHGLQVRLMGGLAFQARSPGSEGGAGRAGAGRRDIDLATRAADARGLTRLLTEAGYEADTHYNALYGRKQLYFLDAAHDRPVDVLIDALEMCHRLEFRERLTVDHPTLPLADLLLTKLQVVQLTQKDALDALLLLGGFALADHDAQAINVGRVISLTSNDWGWWRTTTGNLGRLRELASGSGEAQGLAEDSLRFDPSEQIRALLAAIDQAPKSQRWRLRSRVGDRVRWYSEPEEVPH